MSEELSLYDLRGAMSQLRDAMDLLNLVVETFEPAEMEPEISALETALDQVGLVHAELLNRVAEMES